MSTKTNKSFAKRLRVTKNGAVVASKPGKNHFNAKAKQSKHMDLGRAHDIAHRFTNKAKGQFLHGL